MLGVRVMFKRTWLTRVADMSLRRFQTRSETEYAVSMPQAIPSDANRKKHRFVVCPSKSQASFQDDSRLSHDMSNMRQAIFSIEARLDALMQPRSFERIESRFGRTLRMQRRKLKR